MQANWFADEDHQPFHFPAESGGAMLIHGFMGTPKEMRPLGQALADQGFTAYGPLLPGFGESVRTINSVTRHDWVGHAAQLWQELHRRRKANVLVGFSMGAAVALHLALRWPPNRLILIAPLWKLAGGDWKVHLLPVAKYFVKRLKPFANADFTDEGVRQFFAGAMPELDLDDPAVQHTIRNEVGIPTSTLDELRRLARDGARIARQINIPTLVIQGDSDLTVHLDHTRELVSSMGQNTRLDVVRGGHLIVSSEGESWPNVRRLVSEFADGGES